jgi:hypothetical protein
MFESMPNPHTCKRQISMPPRKGVFNCGSTPLVCFALISHAHIRESLREDARDKREEVTAAVAAAVVEKQYLDELML